ncbi:Hypothetical protein [Corynebacterium glutamicum ATCC 13032]|uniref:Uncharacterized protein n=1 Tax=Corynebacterium glutamicum (strain ATCC 13032 / DSM 20300 / JCM 1318 / BCRC 11384 / CCUG 27702 / LMG 3730 / NBRC 12168 / NCIMB 10025 / NRRL B-2784 / 534) TaxID=196627 RepID=Q8NPW6_CORGL|nr:Hypothetical protein [Corynebacterium glutamicum ATCC 13032]CAF20077.1 putative secreted or membrane protein [Corynebacterium glutamicum ATCC 13032]
MEFILFFALLFFTVALLISIGLIVILVKVVQKRKSDKLEK